ncbi:MAG: DNA polymerase IV [Treponemataceae bacterium]
MEEQSDKIKNCFFHVDLDAFFASVEQLDNPKLKGKPVIVGGLPNEKRGVVSTCSYEARKFGVHSAMNIFEAYRLCPDGIFLHGRMKRYQEKSAEVMKIFNDFSPDVNQMSIDEAFLDMSGTERLFGNPAFSAKKLKAAVYEKTGLTVSVGVASTKYLAKIASGMNKPDGLFVIPYGKEDEFMLSLPLEKVWGIGEKTRAKINRNGFYTTKQIYQVSQELLIGTFGNGIGSFLYNAVRGKTENNFEHEKTKSLSEEKTFEHDLFLQEAMDTMLLEMCSNCFFRMIKNNFVSKTICVKIRYEDFKTVTIQETFSQHISSIDQFFEYGKKLFYKKYEKNRGIRLLGIGFHNIENKNENNQFQLFDFGEEKKQKLEKTISEIKVKNPNVKIKKARLISLLLLSMTLFAFKANAESKIENLQEVKNENFSEQIQDKQDDAPNFLQENTAKTDSVQKNAVEQENKNKTSSTTAEQQETENKLQKTNENAAIFDYKIGNTNIEFFAEGYWKMMFSCNLNLNFYKNGKNNVVYNPFLFSQQIDLSTWLMINNSWYFEGNFSDGFHKNTVAAGYYGNNLIRHIRLGNRNIVFPSIFDNDGIKNGVNGIGGGSEQCPGIMAELGGDTWQLNAVLRYDAVTSNSKTFSGSYEIQEQQILISQWQKGINFYLPPQIAKHVSTIYTEDKNGTYICPDKRKYKKLAASEYSLNCITGNLAFKKTYTGSIIIEFFEGTDIVQIQNEVKKIVNDIQSYFASNSKKSIEPIIEYIGCKPNCSELFTSILGNSGQKLIIQNPGCFSPFWNGSIYKLLSNETSELYLQSSGSAISAKDYSVLVIQNEEEKLIVDNSTTKNFFNYAQIYKNENSTYECAKRFPLADKLPEIYLNSSTFAENQSQRELALVLVEKQAKHVTNYFIGMQAIPGTIRVYRNNIQDTKFSFNQETGCIHFANPPSDSEKINVSWQESSDSMSLGVITSALGFKLDINENMQFITSITSQWNAPWQKTYADNTKDFPGFVKSNSKYIWEQNGFSLKENLNAVWDVKNSTGLYRLMGFSKNSTSNINLSTKHFILNKKFLPSLNSKSSVIFPVLNFDTYMDNVKLSLNGDNSVKNSGVKIEWNTKGQKTNSENFAWFSYDMSLENSGSLLQNAEEIEINLKHDLYFANGANLPCKYDVYLQLGIDSSKDAYYENSTLIPTWKISKESNSDPDSTNVISSFITSNSYKNVMQNVKIKLTGIDRERVLANNDARIIIVQKINDFSSEISGSITAGKIKIPNTSFASQSGLEAFSYSQETPPTTLHDINIFNQDSINYQECLTWKKYASQDFENVKFHKFFETVDLKYYKSMNMFFKIGENSTGTDIKFVFAEPSSLGSFKNAISFTLPCDFVNSLGNNYHILTIDFFSGQISIDGVKKEIYAYINTGIAPSVFTVEFLQNDTFPIAQADFKYGSFIIDEIYLAGTKSVFSVDNKLNSEYKKNGVFLKTKQGIPIFADANIQGEFIAGTSSLENSGFLIGSAKGEITVFGLKIAGTGNKEFSQNMNNNLFYGSHCIQTTELVKPFKYVKFSEEYYYAGSGKQSEKTDKISFFIPAGKSYINIGASTKATQSIPITKQIYTGNFDFTIPIKSCNWNSKIKYNADQYKNTVHKNKENYFDEWYEISKNQFTCGYENATRRYHNFTVIEEILIPYASLKPNFTFNGKNIFSKTNQIYNKAENEFIGEIPFSLKNNNFSLSYAYKISYTNNNSNVNDYKDDLLNFFTATKQNNLYTCENQTYKINYKRENFYNWKDLLIPSGFTGVVSTNLNTDNTTWLQNYTECKASLAYNAINIFGSTGQKKLFDWYEQDEFLTSISFALQVSNIDRTVPNWNVSSLLRQSIYFTKTNYLQLLTEFQIKENNLWNIKSKLSWTRKGKRSFITDIAKIFIKDKDNFSPNFDRQNHLKYSVNKDEYVRHLIELHHSIIIKIGNYAKIKSDVGTSFVTNKDVFSWNTTASIIGSLNF